MNSTTVATPAILSARDQRAASNLKAGRDDPLDAAAGAAGAAGAAAGGEGAAVGIGWVAVAVEPSGAPQLGQSWRRRRLRSDTVDRSAAWRSSIVRAAGGRAPARCTGCFGPAGQILGACGPFAEGFRADGPPCRRRARTVHGPEGALTATCSVPAGASPWARAGSGGPPCSRRPRCSATAVGTTARQGDGHVGRRGRAEGVPPSTLWATAPVPTAGVPAQLVPTIAHSRDDGHAMP